MHLRGTALTLALWTAPLAVAAQACPTADALDQGGILFTVDDGTELHTRAANGAITVVSSEDEDGFAVRTILMHGVHVLQLADIESGTVVPGSIWRFVFPLPITELPEPMPDGTWKTETVVMIDGDADTESVSHTWGPAAPFVIGACTYEGVPVSVAFDSEDYAHTEDMMYLPGLGTGLLLRYSDSDATDVYTYRDVRAQ